MSLASAIRDPLENVNNASENTKNTGLYWKEVCATPPYIFNKSTCTVFKDSLIFFGFSTQHSSQPEVEIASFDLKTSLWSKVDIEKPFNNFARIFHTACVANENEIIIYGGRRVVEFGEDLVVLRSRNDDCDDDCKIFLP